MEVGFGSVEEKVVGGDKIASRGFPAANNDDFEGHLDVPLLIVVETYEVILLPFQVLLRGGLARGFVCTRESRKIQLC